MNVDELGIIIYALVDFFQRIFIHLLFPLMIEEAQEAGGVILTGPRGQGMMCR